MNKKGALMELSSLQGAAISFMVLAIVLGLAATILVQVQATQTAGSVAYNATGRGLTAISDFSSWLPTIVVIVIAVVILGLIGAFLYSRR